VLHGELTMAYEDEGGVNVNIAERQGCLMSGVWCLTVWCLAVWCLCLAVTARRTSVSNYVWAKPDLLTGRFASRRIPELVALRLVASGGGLDLSGVAEGSPSRVLKAPVGFLTSFWDDDTLRAWDWCNSASLWT
jgi:hypothetical protein